MKRVLDMQKVAQDVIEISIKDTDTLKACKNKFYRVMRKHGIKKGMQSADGKSIIFDNFEWTICWEMFLGRLRSSFELTSLMTNVPKDLIKY